MQRIAETPGSTQVKQETSPPGFPHRDSESANVQFYWIHIV